MYLVFPEHVQPPHIHLSHSRAHYQNCPFPALLGPLLNKLLVLRVAPVNGPPPSSNEASTGHFSRLISGCPDPNPASWMIGQLTPMRKETR